MKRYCKNFVLTPDFIQDCIIKFMDCSNQKNRWKRMDVAYFFAYYYLHKRIPSYNNARFTLYLMQHDRDLIRFLYPEIAKDLYIEITERKIKLKPIEYQERYDYTSGKIRTIGISSIKQQILDYVAVESCKDMFHAKIGRFQCASLKDRGPLYGVKAIQKWIKKDPNSCKWVFKCDIRKYYPSINHNILIKFLERDIKNSTIIYLLKTLIKTYIKGLCIGSFLSQYLANYFLSYLYHFACEQCYKFRKNKRTGETKRVNLVNHVLFYMDDILLLGSSKKYVAKAAEMIERFANNILGLVIKPTKRLFKLANNFIDIMGYKIYKDHIAIRKKTFKKMRRKWIRYKNRKIDVHNARSVCSTYGFVMHTDSFKIIKKYKLKKLIERAKEVVSTYDRRIYRNATCIQI